MADTQEYEWTYMGQRMGAKSKPVYAWLGHDDQVRYYGGTNITPSAGVGAVYAVHVDMSGDSATVSTGGTKAPRYLRMTDPATAGPWELDDQIVRARVEADRARRRASNEHPMGTLTLDELTAAYQGLATADQRAGMLAAHREISGAGTMIALDFQPRTTEALSMTTTQDIEAAVAATDFGTPTAHKRGRNPRWPYVPVIIHPTDVPDKTWQEQLVKKAFATRTEAIDHAQAVIDNRRRSLADRLAMPNNRALRAQHGVAS